MRLLGFLTAVILVALSPSAFAQNGRFSQDSCAEHCAIFCQTAQNRKFCLGYCPADCAKQRAQNGSPVDVTGSINKPSTTGSAPSANRR
jgi:hypothetical protein